MLKVQRQIVLAADELCKLKCRKRDRPTRKPIPELSTRVNAWRILETITGNFQKSITKIELTCLLLFLCPYFTFCYVLPMLVLIQGFLFRERRIQYNTSTSWRESNPFSETLIGWVLYTETSVFSKKKIEERQAWNYLDIKSTY